MTGWCTAQRARLILAWSLIAACVIGWPVSALTFASSEPKTVLGLSWVALIITAANVLLTTTVRNKQDDDPTPTTLARSRAVPSPETTGRTEP